MMVDRFPSCCGAVIVHDFQEPKKGVRPNREKFRRQLKRTLNEFLKREGEGVEVEFMFNETVLWFAITSHRQPQTEGLLRHLGWKRFGRKVVNPRTENRLQAWIKVGQP